ncbi:hypothetical protein C0J52_12919 [Blattella germanica]|nr:hypothetical protein C0J52_12919 [Blattella germanica]
MTLTNNLPVSLALKSVKGPSRILTQSNLRQLANNYGSSTYENVENNVIRKSSTIFRTNKAYSSYTGGIETVLPKQSQVVVCGAGTVANSVAYHLVQNGWNDILVLEQQNIGSGTSHFGSGTLGLFKPIADRNLIMYSIKLYRRLQELGYDIGFKQSGSVNLAQTKDRLIALKRRMAYHQATGLHCEVVGNKELKKYHPYLKTEDLEGAIWVPEDAVAKPQAICEALAKLAKEGGARYVENCQVQQVLTENGHVKGVETNLGTVYCEYFVNCAGMWARDLGLKCSPTVRVPAIPAEHFYVTTSCFEPSLDSILPCVRDYDSQIYFREWDGGFMIGGFELEAKPAFGGARIPEDWKNRVPQDWKHFILVLLRIQNVSFIVPLWEKAIHRVPILKDVHNPILTNSPDNFTPDGRWILGETPEVTNYYVAVGMNGNSLQGAGGIGKAVAEWIIEGEPTTDVIPFSVQRFVDLHNNRQYLLQRTKEVVGRHYAILYPHQCEYKYARKLRCSPLYSVLEKRDGDPPPQMPTGSFYKPKFFDFMREEYLACREGVGIIDMSSFSKIIIKSSGNEVVHYLQRLCSNDVNIPVGGIVHTGMQNEHGGYENDCMIVRQNKNSGQAPPKIGRDYGARDVGCLTQRFMRIEKFIAFWAEELTSLTTPYEAGAGHRVKLDKEYFIGKFALQRQKEQGVTQRLVFFVLEDIDPDIHIWPWGGEPLYRNGEFVGTVTSSGYGFTLDKLICLGYIRHPHMAKASPNGRHIVTNEFIMDHNARYEVDIAGQRFLAKPHIHAPHIPHVSMDTTSRRYRPTVASLKAN